MLQLRQAPLRRFEPGRGWQSPVTIPRHWLAALFVGCTLFALGMGVFSSDALHRLWGLFAAGAYVLAAVIVLAWKSARSVDLALVLSFGGALIAPLAILAEQGKWQPEVGVIARGAQLMVHHGSPYLSDAVVRATHDPNIYNPYLPVMALFGIPRALFGPGLVTDPRVWFCLGFVVLFAAALAVAGARDVVRWTVLVTATPVIAFSLTVGGTDVPVLALICLGLALLWQHPRPLLAGAVLGIACATKATAWPALVVAGTMVLVRDGRRTAAQFSATAVVVACAIIVPVALLGMHALVDNTILFPLGLASVKSAAVSPLPGHVLADIGHTGHLIAVSLLGLAGLGVLVSLVIQPPRTVAAATWRLIIGLVLMFTLAPATRFGYFMYPLGLWAWLTVSQLGLRRSRAPAPDDGEPDGPASGGLARVA
jgi:Glycosyltransferase family 87